MTEKQTKRHGIITKKVDNTHGYIELDDGERIGRGWFTNEEWDESDISSKLEYTVDEKQSLISIITT